MMSGTNTDELAAVHAALERKHWRLDLPPMLEAQFEAKTGQWRNRNLSIWLIFALAISAAYLAVDVLSPAPVSPAVPLLHYGLCLVLLLAALTLAAQPPIWVCSLAVVVAYVARTAIDSWVGLHLTAPFGDRLITVTGFMILFVNVTSPLRFRDALLLSVLSLLAFAGVLCGTAQQTDVPELDHVVSAAIVVTISVGIVLQQEHTRRQTFLLGRLADLRLQELARMSEADALTSLPNRRAFEKLLAKQWLLDHETGASLGLLIVDVDNFKAINDIDGHAAGDECLRNLAAVMVASTRPGSDVVARLGGEEFAVVLTNIDLLGAAEIAERLRCAVEAAGFRHPHGGVVTVSIGCGVAEPSLGGRSETLLGGADHALYAAKALGKNRVANWSGIVDLPPDSAGWVNATQLKAAQLNATGLS